MTRLFIEPNDIVFFRDDLPFGAVGNQVGRCQFPPRPSVVAGALRTKALTNASVDFTSFREGAVPEAVAEQIGRVRGERLSPGSFSLTAFGLGRRQDGRETEFFRAGRDLVMPGKRAESGSGWRLLSPSGSSVIPGSSSLGAVTPLAVVPGFEPFAGWLDAPSFSRYLTGDRSAIGSGDAESAVVWKTESDVLAWDHRVGIALNPSTRTVNEGALFSSRGAVMKPGWGFAVTVEGCSLLPATGLLRLGGDGRMASLSEWRATGLDVSAVRRAVVASGRFRWVLATPAIFERGWLPGAVRQDASGLVYERDGFRARLVSAALGSPELAGGWDLLRGRRGAPKPFRRMVPAGSVYWFEVLSGSGEGAWNLFQGTSVSDEKRNEGFGLVHVGGWPNV